MFTRLVSYHGANDFDAGIAFIRETVAPLLHQQKGFRGLTVSADRQGGLLAALTLWDSAADREASESALLKVRDEGKKIIGGEVTVDLFEEVLAEFPGGSPQPGARLLVTRVSMDPAKLDENIGYFNSEVLPDIKAQPGLLALRHMINRDTGQALLGTVWADADALAAATAHAEETLGREDTPVTREDVSQREILLVDLV